MKLLFSTILIKIYPIGISIFTKKNQIKMKLTFEVPVVRTSRSPLGAQFKVLTFVFKKITLDNFIVLIE